MNKRLKTVVIVLILVAVGYIAYSMMYKKSSTTIQVKTTQLTGGSISSNVTATGTLEPVTQVSVGTQVSGLINKIYVDFNSDVKKGQLLAELDRTSLSEQVSNAKAQYNAAMNELKYYEQNYNRKKSMFDAQVVSKSDLEQAEYQYINAKNNLSQRQTTLSQAQTNLGYTYIYSPIDGIVISREVDEGQTVAASMSTPELFTIAMDLTKMQVEADVDEADIGDVRVGQRVEFGVDAFPEETFGGSVQQIRLNPTISSNVVTYTVIISTDNPDLKLKPGLTATATIYTKELNNIQLLSSAALNFMPDINLLMQYYKDNDIEDRPPMPNHDDSKTYVWVQDASKVLSQKEVATGESDGINVQVVSGLSSSDKVVTSLREVNLEEKNSPESSSSSPFMPTPPKRGNQKSNSSQSQGQGGPPPN
ncbi:MAG: efflux RND transporter periplasmic adaptor subunit [Bacteroidales bacterium]